MSSGHGFSPTQQFTPYDLRIGTHYDILGLAPDASPEQVRTSYRDRARQVHPDRRGGAATGANDMAAVNEAYRVLSDPRRRMEYDRSLTSAAPSATTARDPHQSRDEEFVPPPPEPGRLIPPGPAKVPWKLMAITTVVGSLVVLVAAAFNDPPGTEVPDGILRVGSCVQVEANGDVREIACTGTDADLVVDLVLPTDARCPTAMGSYRDRLGLGTVCIEADR